MQERWETVVACKDGSGRPKYTRVTVTDDANIAVVTPPGDAAVIRPGEVHLLQQALTNAHIEAVNRMGGGR